MAKYYIHFFVALSISCSSAKRTSSVSTTIQQKKILPTVIYYVKEENVPQAIKFFIDSCFKEYSVEIITMDEGKTLAHNATAEVYRTASLKPDISPEEMQRMVAEDIKYAYNLISFKLIVEPVNTLREISWTISSWPVNKKSKKPLMHNMPPEKIYQNDWKKTITQTIDSVLNTRLLN
jgi:hypothetical protein